MIFPVLFKAYLILKDISRKPFKFKFFSSLCEPCFEYLLYIILLRKVLGDHSLLTCTQYNVSQFLYMFHFFLLVSLTAFMRYPFVVIIPRHLMSAEYRRIHCGSQPSPSFSVLLDFMTSCRVSAVNIAERIYRGSYIRAQWHAILNLFNKLICLFDLILYVQINSFSVMSGWVFLG